MGHPSMQIPSEEEDEKKKKIIEIYVSATTREAFDAQRKSSEDREADPLSGGHVVLMAFAGSLNPSMAPWLYKTLTCVHRPKNSIGLLLLLQPPQEQAQGH